MKPKNKFKKKILFPAAIGFFLIFLGLAQPAQADTPSILGSLFTLDGVKSGFISGIMEGLTYFFAWIFGALISVETWLISVVLNINAGIMQTSFVQTGFSVSLSVANLAFVLGIIVIALATILRIESYSIKKMLWKLVVMAILVNFGLVIIAPIVGFANGVTQYFLNSFPGQGGFDGFASTFAGKFNPQAMFATVSNPTPGTGLTNPPFSALAQAAGSSISSSMVPIFSMIFTIVDFMLIVFVLGAFIIMLIIRYIYIAILAILLPFAWASWVFPSFSSMNKKWWDKFLQWTFFAPIFMFFLYLALSTIAGAQNGDAFAIGGYTQGNALFSPITAFFGSLITPILTNFLQEVTLGGMIIGGMIAADSMGVKASGAIMTGAKKIANNKWTATRKRYSDMRDRQRARHLNTPAERAKTTAMYDSNNVIRRMWADRRAKIADKGGKNSYAEEFKGMGKERAMGQLQSTARTGDGAKRQALLDYIADKKWESDARVHPFLSGTYKEEAKRYENDETFDKMRTKTGIGLKEAVDGGDQEKVAEEVKKMVASDSETLASTFLSPEDLQKVRDKAAKDGKPVPLFAQNDALAAATQKAILLSIPKLSSANVASLMTEVSKKNNVDGFVEAFKQLGQDEKAAAKTAFEGNKDLFRWIKKSPHKTVVDFEELYGLPKGDAASTPSVVTPKPSDIPGSGRSQSDIDARNAARRAAVEQAARERGGGTTT